MATKTQQEIKGNFNWTVPPQVSTSFITGEDARLVYEHMQEMFGKGFWYDEESKTMKGSNFPIAARLDTILRNLKSNPSGIRVATLADLSRPEVMGMIRDKHYSNTPELVLRTEQDIYEPNNSLIKRLLPYIEEKQGRLQLPVKTIGLDVDSDKNEYGWNVAPRDDFDVLYDDRLEGKYHGKSFSNVDKLGLPIFDKEGKRTWYARDKGLSRFDLDRNLDLDLDDEHLDDSNDYGRVVLIAATPRADFFSKYTAEVEAEYKRQESELLERKERALRILKGKE